MHSDSDYKGDLLTFFELLEKYPVEVPIIQRDYAQGRKSQSKVRESFLKALYKSLNNEEPLMLDFIYGSLDEEKFQPLDGQQRLTTLFLLHCYGSIICEVSNQETEILKRFSYETRMTSRDFCKKLVDNLGNLSQININKQANSEVFELGSVITDSSWFFLSWRNDPTIDAMLTTLNDIHHMFSNIKNLWRKLTQEKIIQFYYIELEHLGLTDDLYIKMNARGRLLTTFENFKASIEKKLSESIWEKDIDIKDTFNIKIDGQWTDLFWNNFKVGTSIDEAFVRFFAFVFMVDSTFSKNLNTDDRNEIVRQLQDNSHNISIELLTKDAFKRLVSYLNILNRAYPIIVDNELHLDFFRHSPDKNFLHEMLTNTNEVSYTQKVLLFAQIQYFLNLNDLSDFNSNFYNNWMRVIRNIIALGDVDQNGKRPDIIRTHQAFPGVLNLISEISNGSNNIYEYLADNSNKISSAFSRTQVEEERVKAYLILSDPNREKTILELESTDILRGRLEFIFYCIDFNPNFDLITDSSFNDNKFKIVAKTFIQNLGNESCLTNNLRRALLTIEVDNEFKFYDYWHSYWYHLEKDMIKRKLVSKYREIEYILHSDHREYFKKLILSLESQDLIDIINNFSPLESFPQWKLILIKNTLLLDNSKSKFIAISDDDKFCYLLKSARPRNAEGSTRIPPLN
ncbi:MULTISPECIES: DUF262 domain-containing protein [unclassified Psychrobacter]|uniref:DUF262 domain-containing protein n=1 Tax=unclassified Psychrobacter TaxID=196806 RepID=UPI001918608F|nr:DUF262 domain-containing protein [Psychrobacter sp. Pi2-51]